MAGCHVMVAQQLKQSLLDRRLAAQQFKTLVLCDKLSPC